MRRASPAKRLRYGMGLRKVHYVFAISLGVIAGGWLVARTGTSEFRALYMEGELALIKADAAIVAERAGARQAGRFYLRFERARCCRGLKSGAMQDRWNVPDRYRFVARRGFAQNAG